MSDPYSLTPMLRPEFISALAESADGDDEKETQNIILHSMDRWARDEIDSAAIDGSSEIPEKLLTDAKQMGLFGMTIPQEYDGAGFSMKATSHVLERLAFHDCSMATTIGLHAGLGLRGLIRFGSDSLKKRYLPKLADGRLIAAFAVTEPNAGSDLAAVSTTAVEDGENLILNGEKAFITNGGFAGLATVYAQTPGMGGVKKGKSNLIVPLDLQGVKRGREEHKLGIKGTSTVSLNFNETIIPRDHIIGEPGNGPDQNASILSWGRTFLSAGSVGLGTAAFQKAVEYVNTRKQFGRTIGQFGMVREMIAETRAKLYAAQSLVRLTTQLQDKGVEDISWESAVTKVFSTEAAWNAADRSVQLHGGMGFIEETGVARILRDSRIGRIFEGANELLRVHVASVALGWKSEKVKDEDWATLIRNPLLDESRQRLIRMTALAEKVLSEIKKTNGVRVFLNQILLGRLADLQIQTYAILAVVLRTQGELEKSSETIAVQKAALCNYTTQFLEAKALEVIEKIKSKDENRATMISNVEYEAVC